VRPLRRLYSTFAGGWPGVGLILMRLAIAAALLTAVLGPESHNPANTLTLLSLLISVAALFVVVGLYTPIVGTLVALLEVSRAVSTSSDRSMYLLVAAVAAALAMLGPGLWSIDARMFGWKRIEPSARKRYEQPSE